MNFRTFIGAVIIAVILVGSGFFAGRETAPQSKDTETTNSSTSYPLLSKRLFIEDPNDTLLNFVPLRQELNNYFEGNKLNGSLYFEYLPTGTSIRIDGDKMEVAASLMKLPLAMELYKAQEQGVIDLNSKITLQESWLDGAYGSLYKKGAGYSLTLKEAAEIMLKESDNTALKAIANATQDKILTSTRVFNYLDIEITQNYDLTVSISAKSYSSILKCLYFSCYLNKDHSEELLSYLTESAFNDRLVAGISDNIKVAHKIGVASETNQSDCGIIYLNKRNYTLCIMLNGPDDGSLNPHFKALSKKTYDYLKSLQ